jgi:phosphatidylserine/phosphatidylglycerophosphate/cardiolipin synthase-like enzyme
MVDSGDIVREALRDVSHRDDCVARHGGTLMSQPVDPEVAFLTDGGQPASSVLERLIAFLEAARTSLDLAIYDAHLEGEGGDRLLAALDNAEQRGVQVRAVYNDDHRNHTVPPPSTMPSLLEKIAASVPATAIPGIPDLMHNKYVIRDGDTVWTGSTNWTDDAWSRMENLLITIPSPDLAAAYTEDFEQLWQKKHVLGTGKLDDLPAALSYQGAPFSVRVLFSPGRGRAMGHLVARRIGQATQRIRICSPVITSGPILSTLAEVLDDKRAPALITVDAPQMHEALSQWQSDGRASWKVPLVQRLLSSGVVAQKHSRAYQAGPPHNYMHAKVVVCDDVVLTGSYNLSHSGEMNAENLLEIESKPFADQCAAFSEQVHARYA